MAITNFDGVIAGGQQHVYWYKTVPFGAGTVPLNSSYWATAGFPTAGTYNGTLAGGTYSSTGGYVTGMIPHTDPGSGNAYVARFSVMAGNAGGAGSPGLYMLCDRLWDNGGISITSTAAQTVNSPTWPARDGTGSTNGVGVLIALEVSGETGNGTPTLTLSYTNSVGTSGRTGTNIDPTGNTRAAGTFIRFNLQAGDIGVQSIQSYTQSATWVSGTVNLVAYRVLACTSIRGSTGGSNAVDCIKGGFQRVYNGTVPFIVAINGINNANQLPNLCGEYVETQG